MKKIFSLLAVALLSGGHPLRALPAEGSAVIAQIRVSGNIVTTNEKRILKFLPFKAGERFDPYKLQEGIRNLNRWGIFEKVEVHTEQTPEGLVIAIQVSEGKIIGEITIKGNYPYIEAKIRKRINLEVGNILIPALLEEQAKRIKRFYLRKGYFNTVVRTKVSEAAANNTVLVTFHIYKGNRLRYSHVAFEGVKAIPVGRLHSFIGLMDIHSKQRLRESIQKMTRHYRSKGYLKAKIRVLEKKIDWKTRKVSLKLGVEEGPRVKILFRGKSPLRLRTLKKTVTLYEEGNFDTVELELSATALLKRLHKEGYLEGQVTFTKTKLRKDLYAVEFRITPGVRSYVYSIEFEGNRAIAARTLRNQLFTKELSITQKGILEESLLYEDRKILIEYYQSQGFPDVFVSLPQLELSPSRIRWRVRYKIQEGAFIPVKNVFFEGTSLILDEKFMKNLKNREGSLFNKFYLPYDLEQVKLFYTTRGYPYPVVDQKIDRVARQITITYRVEEGPLAHIGDIYYIGDILTGVRAMRQAIRIQSGELYNYQKIIEAQLKLRRLGVFNSAGIEPIGLEEKATTIPLKVKVEERKPFVLDVEGKYSTDTQFSGTLKFTNFNSFGWAKQTRLLFTGGLEKDRAEISWLDPILFGKDVQMNLASWIDYEQKVIETSLQTGGAVSFFRIFRRFGFLGRYQLTRNYVFEGQALDPASLRDSTLSEITLSSTYDTRNSFSIPSRGIFATGGVQIFNELGGPEANFAKWKFGITHYLPVADSLTLANTFRFNRIENIGSAASIPQRELLTLGGDDTLRGFKEDRVGPLDANSKPVGGRLRLVLNSEFQFRLAKSFQLALFHDAGALTNSFGEIDLGTLRNSAGVGLRYITPVGPIRADYGIILDRLTGENFGRFHLTFGHVL